MLLGLEGKEGGSACRFVSFLTKAKKSSDKEFSYITAALKPTKNTPSLQQCSLSMH